MWNNCCPQPCNPCAVPCNPFSPCSSPYAPTQCFSNITVTCDLTVTRHIIAKRTAAPTLTSGGVATAVSAVNTLTDIAGNIAVTTTGVGSTGTVTVTYATAYTSVPTVVVTSASINTTGVYVSASSISSFTVTFTSSATTSNAFNYIVIGTSS